MNIFTRIEKDHEAQRGLMERIIATEGSSKEREELFAEFCVEFLAHAAAEEHAFYAEMLKHEETTNQSRHSVAEHSSAIELIEKLKKTDMSSAAWLVTFKALAHENEHHMKEEEDDVFPLVKKELNDATIEKMLAVFNERKEQEQSSVGSD